MGFQVYRARKEKEAGPLLLDKRAFPVIPEDRVCQASRGGMDHLARRVTKETPDCRASALLAPLACQVTPVRMEHRAGLGCRD